MEKKNLKKPFFASFLEKQLKEPQKIKGGGIAPDVTSKLADAVTSPNKDQVTMKYPSDSDEAGELS
ncbi:hypothetical protein M2347_000178 [Chryseobacterium sp. H1D6B]|uniref:microviridin/marinostatin family tricyclic proteinase inhibitor n=1 Tax=Chryseobacterium sp. H1D6B TaxID=2940588 RepID=UPI0015C75032|nr:microviridin/marinostatin family tricyclic proteinase inhibitor [Chryseobacterium sp. H1D6B]MDH6250451.1 hypothetical protein [Chryseobacterium sp. H1D6B]